MPTERALASEASRVDFGAAAATGGCIVTRGSSPMELVVGVPGLPAEGVLMHGRRATVFPTSAGALHAIRRSWAYAGRKGYDWGQQRTAEWRIWTLVEVDSRSAGAARLGSHEGWTPDRSDA